MVKLSRADEEHILDLLRDETEYARDCLPYTKDFERLKSLFYDRTFKKLTDEDFWGVLVRVAKKGGVRGKTGCASPELTDEHRLAIRELLPVDIGSRDRLPYSGRFDRMHQRFTERTGQELDKRGLWLAVLHLAK